MNALEVCVLCFKNVSTELSKKIEQETNTLYTRKRKDPMEQSRHLKRNQR